MGTLAAGLPIALAIGALTLAAIEDVRRLTIRNRYTLAVIAAWLLWVALPPWPTPMSIGLDVATAAAFFALALALFAIGALGGGDGKLLAALGLWAGPLGAIPMLLAVVLAGGCLALAVMAAGLVSRWRQPVADRGPWREALRRPIPYGVAIAVGGIMLLAQRLGAIAASAA